MRRWAWAVMVLVAGCEGGGSERAPDAVDAAEAPADTASVDAQGDAAGDASPAQDAATDACLAQDVATDAGLDAAPTSDADAGSHPAPITRTYALKLAGATTSRCRTTWDGDTTRTACVGTAASDMVLQVPATRGSVTRYEGDAIAECATWQTLDYAADDVTKGVTVTREGERLAVTRNVRGWEWTIGDRSQAETVWIYADPAHAAAIARLALATPGHAVSIYEPAQDFENAFTFNVGESAVTIQGTDYTISVDPEDGTLVSIDYPSAQYQVTRIDPPKGIVWPDPVAVPPVVDALPYPPPALPPVTVTPFDLTSGDGTVLGCKLYAPPGASWPAAMVANGSGPYLMAFEDQEDTPLYDELGHRLAADGIALVQCDKRGMDAWSPSAAFEEPLSSDQQADVVAGIEWLRARPEVTQVFVIGQSMGGWHAPRIAKAAPVDGIVMLSACGGPMAVIMKEQMAYVMDFVGLDAATKVQTLAAMDAEWAQIQEGTFTGGLLGSDPAWWQDAKDVDAIADLAGLDVPLLVLHGGEDTICTGGRFDAMAAALADRPDTELVLFPQADHVLKAIHGPGARAEYRVPRWIPSGTVTQLLAWLHAHAP